jgi:putative transposase
VGSVKSQKPTGDPFALPLTEYRQRYSDRIEAMARVYLSGVYTMPDIGAHFGVHYMTVSRAVRRFELNSWD